MTLAVMCCQEFYQQQSTGPPPPAAYHMPPGPRLPYHHVAYGIAPRPSYPHAPSAGINMYTHRHSPSPPVLTSPTSPVTASPPPWRQPPPPYVHHQQLPPQFVNQPALHVSTWLCHSLCNIMLTV